MRWTCPNCRREFAKPNQSHSCESKRLEEHFKNIPDDILLMFASLMEKVEGFGKIAVTPVKNAILVSAKTNFLSIKPKKQALEIEYLLDKKREEEFVYKIFQVSKYRFAHYARLTEASDLSPKLLAALRASYELVNNAL